MRSSKTSPKKVIISNLKNSPTPIEDFFKTNIDSQTQNDQDVINALGLALEKKYRNNPREIIDFMKSIMDSYTKARPGQFSPSRPYKLLADAVTMRILHDAAYDFISESTNREELFARFNVEVLDKLNPLIAGYGQQWSDAKQFPFDTKSKRASLIFHILSSTISDEDLKILRELCTSRINLEAREFPPIIFDDEGNYDARRTKDGEEKYNILETLIQPNVKGITDERLKLLHQLGFKFNAESLFKLIRYSYEVIRLTDEELTNRIREIFNLYRGELGGEDLSESKFDSLLGNLENTKAPAIAIYSILDAATEAYQSDDNKIKYLTRQRQRLEAKQELIPKLKSKNNGKFNLGLLEQPEHEVKNELEAFYIHHLRSAIRDSDHQLVELFIKAGLTDYDKKEKNGNFRKLLETINEKLQSIISRNATNATISENEKILYSTLLPVLYSWLEYQDLDRVTKGMMYALIESCNYGFNPSLYTSESEMGNSLIQLLQTNPENITTGQLADLLNKGLEVTQQHIALATEKTEHITADVFNMLLYARNPQLLIKEIKEKLIFFRPDKFSELANLIKNNISSLKKSPDGCDSLILFMIRHQANPAFVELLLRNNITPKSQETLPLIAIYKEDYRNKFLEQREMVNNIFGSLEPTLETELEQKFKAQDKKFLTNSPHGKLHDDCRSAHTIMDNKKGEYEEATNRVTKHLTSNTKHFLPLTDDFITMLSYAAVSNRPIFVRAARRWLDANAASLTNKDKSKLKKVAQDLLPSLLGKEIEGSNLVDPSNEQSNRQQGREAIVEYLKAILILSSSQEEELPDYTSVASNKKQKSEGSKLFKEFIEKIKDDYINPEAIKEILSKKTRFKGRDVPIVLTEFYNNFGETACLIDFLIKYRISPKLIETVIKDGNIQPKITAKNALAYRKGYRNLGGQYLINFLDLLLSDSFPGTNEDKDTVLTYKERAEQKDLEEIRRVERENLFGKLNNLKENIEAGAVDRELIEPQLNSIFLSFDYSSILSDEAIKRQYQENLEELLKLSTTSLTDQFISNKITSHYLEKFGRKPEFIDQLEKDNLSRLLKSLKGTINKNLENKDLDEGLIEYKLNSIFSFVSERPSLLSNEAAKKEYEGNLKELLSLATKLESQSLSDNIADHYLKKFANTQDKPAEDKLKELLLLSAQLANQFLFDKVANRYLESANIAKQNKFLKIARIDLQDAIVKLYEPAQKTDQIDPAIPEKHIEFIEHIAEYISEPSRISLKDITEDSRQEVKELSTQNIAKIKATSDKFKQDHPELARESARESAGGSIDERTSIRRSTMEEEVHTSETEQAPASITRKPTALGRLVESVFKTGGRKD